MIREGRDIRLNRTGKIHDIEVICKKSTYGCLGCLFCGCCDGNMIGRPYCFSIERPDRESVIFKQYKEL